MAKTNKVYSFLKAIAKFEVLSGPYGDFAGNLTLTRHGKYILMSAYALAKLGYKPNTECTKMCKGDKEYKRIGKTAYYTTCRKPLYITFIKESTMSVKAFELVAKELQKVLGKQPYLFGEIISSRIAKRGYAKESIVKHMPSKFRDEMRRVTKTFFVNEEGKAIKLDAMYCNKGEFKIPMKDGKPNYKLAYNVYCKLNKNNRIGSRILVNIEGCDSYIKLADLAAQLKLETKQIPWLVSALCAHAETERTVEADDTLGWYNGKLQYTCTGLTRTITTSKTGRVYTLDFAGLEGDYSRFKERFNLIFENKTEEPVKKLNNVYLENKGDETVLNNICRIEPVRIYKKLYPVGFEKHESFEEALMGLETQVYTCRQNYPFCPLIVDIDIYRTDSFAYGKEDDDDAIFDKNDDEVVNDDEFNDFMLYGLSDNDDDELEITRNKLLDALHKKYRFFDEDTIAPCMPVFNIERTEFDVKSTDKAYLNSVLILTRLVNNAGFATANLKSDNKYKDYYNGLVLTLANNLDAAKWYVEHADSTVEPTTCALAYKHTLTPFGVANKFAGFVFNATANTLLKTEAPKKASAKKVVEQQINVGNAVNHKLFGNGTVTEINGKVVTVKFATGTKKLSIDYVSLVK